MLRISLQANLYMTHEVFVVDVVVTDLTWETIAVSVISWPTNATTKLNAIIKCISIEGFMKGTILFPWPWRCMVHPSMIWIISSKIMLVFFMIDNQEVICPYIFAFNFSDNVLILFSNLLWPLL